MWFEFSLFVSRSVSGSIKSEGTNEINHQSLRLDFAYCIVQFDSFANLEKGLFRDELRNEKEEAWYDH